MPLEEYRRKRDAAKTPEPAVAAPEATEDTTGGSEEQRRFVVQEHHARALHWDFRLELDGVLLSWAVPKGPSLDPKVKRLAVHVEDHPVEYGCFQGEIPAGEYGAGQVYVWDRGTWEPHGDPHAGLTKGDFKFVLRGERLRGLWVLVRMKPRAGEKRDNWLLIKERDEFARPESEYSITAEERGPLDAGDPSCDWVPGGGGGGELRRSDSPRRGPAAHGRATGASSAPSPPAELAADLPTPAPAPAPDAAAVPGAAQEPLSSFVAPALATLVPDPPLGDDWVHEVKFDGYRLLARVEAGKARLLTRNEKDWTDRFTALATALGALPVTDALIDGEVVALDSEGRSDFGALQEAIAAKRTDGLAYYAFDLLHLDGYDLRRSPLTDRKAALEAIVSRAPATGPVRYSAHVGGSGERFRARACEFQLEGVVSKRADSAYLSGRSRAWLKSKCLSEQEFVVTGWLPGKGARAKLGALALGYYDATGALRTAGRAGSGFTEATIADLLPRLESLETAESPVQPAPPSEAKAGAHWVRPELVAQVRFAEWTRDGRLRQPVFLGLREDKPAREVVAEDPQADATGDPVGSAPPAPHTAAREDGALPAPADGIVVERGKTVGYVAGTRLTHPDRELFAESRTTKFDLARYYEAVWHRMARGVVDRPLTLVRCPHGVGEGCFYQRHMTDASRRPPHVRGVRIPGMTVTEDYIALDSLEGLLEVVQLGALEIHAWGCSASDTEHPDRLTFDLDPDVGLPFERVVDGAKLLRTALEAVGLSAYVKTTGGKGLHVVTPLEPAEGWVRAEEFARALAMQLVEAAPERYTANMRKAVRTNAVFLDYVRNTKSSSAVAAYSSRARDGAPVATPLAWEELGPDLDPSAFTVDTVPARLGLADPWAGFSADAKAITPKMRRDVGLLD